MDQDDGAIVERVLAGDRDAFGILIDRHREGATRFALRILRGRADVEDVVQEAWLSFAKTSSPSVEDGRCSRDRPRNARRL